MAERLSAPMRDGLDALIAVDDDQPHSPLNRIKASSSSPSVGGMKRLLARLELIEATGVLGVDVGWVNGNYQRILFHSVRTASADRVRRMAAPRRHLALVCFLHQAWRDTLDQAVDMYGKLLDRNRKLVEPGVVPRRNAPIGEAPVVVGELEPLPIDQPRQTAHLPAARPRRTPAECGRGAHGPEEGVGSAQRRHPQSVAKIRPARSAPASRTSRVNRRS